MRIMSVKEKTGNKSSNVNMEMGKSSYYGNGDLEYYPLTHRAISFAQWPINSIKIYFASRLYPPYFLYAG